MYIYLFCHFFIIYETPHIVWTLSTFMSLGMIDLSKCMTVKSAELKAGKKNAFEVSTKDSTYFMFADTEKEKDEWIGAVGRAIVQASTTFTNDDGAEDDGSDDESDS